MYISKIHLENIRCFKELNIDFEHPGASVVIAANNGAGKSAILRSVAMGLCDQNSAAALLRELEGDFVRNGEDSGLIEITLIDGRGPEFCIRTEITSLKAFERVSQGLYQRDLGSRREKPIDENEFPWHRIFVSGYGAGTRTLGTADFQHYVAVDAVYPLYRYDVPLQNPELAWRRLVDNARQRAKGDPKKSQQFADDMDAQIRQLVQPVLTLGPNDQLSLTKTGEILPTQQPVGEVEVDLTFAPFQDAPITENMRGDERRPLED